MPVDQNTLAKPDQCRSRFVQRLAAKIEESDLRWVEFSKVTATDRAGYPANKESSNETERHRENRCG